MYDMHYDLLTILYFRLNAENQFYNPKKVLEDCRKIYNQNVLGGIINLYFMSQKEMLGELDISKEELDDVLGMFQLSIQYLKYLQDNQIIPSSLDFIYSIEGCDYLKGVQDLEQLYELGLGAILPVWNEKNKFGSGIRSKDGLTEMGKQLIQKAAKLGILIDLSHANEKTFYEMLDVLEVEKEKYPDLLVACTHSNVRNLCPRDRNLTDEQLIRLKNIGGYIGLFTNGNFLSSRNKELNYGKRAQEYLKHLEYILYHIEFPLDKIIVSTDDMNFHPESGYHHLEAFPLTTIADDLYEVIGNAFGEDVAQAILLDNPRTIISQIKQKRQNHLLMKKRNL